MGARRDNGTQRTDGNVGHTGEVLGSCHLRCVFVRDSPHKEQLKVTSYDIVVGMRGNKSVRQKKLLHLKQKLQLHAKLQTYIRSERWGQSLTGWLLIRNEAKWGQDG